MAKINESAQRQWADGDVIHGVEYSQERDLIVKAHNDTQQQIDDLKNTSSVTTSMLQNNSVTSDKIVNNAITTAKIFNKSVTGEKLSDNSVTSSHIVDGTVGTDEIADAAITDVKIAPNSVAGTKIPPDAIGTNHIQSKAILTHHIGDRAVTPEKVTPEVVTNLAYTKEETDSQISAALSEGVPPEVIEQIKESVASDITDFRAEINGLNSEKINSLAEDAYGPTKVPVRSTDKPGVYVFKIGSATHAAWKSSMNTVLAPVLLVEYRGVVGGDEVSTVQIVYTSTNESFTRTLNGTVWRSWTRNATYAEVTATKTYVDELPWQKSPLTTDQGLAIPLPANADVHTYAWKTGVYANSTSNTANTPGVGWWIFYVTSQGSNSVTITAQNIGNSNPDYRQKKKVNGVWGPWSDDLFQSVSDGKALIKGTIVTEKGGTVPQAGSTPTFAELNTGIKSIQQGIYQNIRPVLGVSYTDIPPGFIGSIKEITYIYPKTRLIAGVRATSTNSSTSDLYAYSPSGNVSIALVLRDIDGRRWIIGPIAAGGTFYMLGFSISMDARLNSAIYQLSTQSYPWSYSTAMPAGFKTDNTMTLCFAITENTLTSGLATVRYKAENFNINTM